MGLGWVARLGLVFLIAQACAIEAFRLPAPCVCESGRPSRRNADTRAGVGGRRDRFASGASGCRSRRATLYHPARPPARLFFLESPRQIRPIAGRPLA